MRYLIILNDPPYGTERSYNGLRLALALQKRDGVERSGLLIGREDITNADGRKDGDLGDLAGGHVFVSARQGARERVLWFHRSQPPSRSTVPPSW